MQIFHLLFYTNMACPICLGNIVEPGYINCEHLFCYRCIEKWLSQNNNCPLCKTTVQTLRGDYGQKQITAPKVSYDMRMDYYHHGFQRQRRRAPRLPYDEQPDLADFVSHHTDDEILAAEYETPSGKEEIDIPKTPLADTDFSPVYTRTRSRNRQVNPTPAS